MLCMAWPRALSVLSAFREVALVLVWAICVFETGIDCGVVSLSMVTEGWPAVTAGAAAGTAAGAGAGAALCFLLAAASIASMIFALTACCFSLIRAVADTSKLESCALIALMMVVS